MGEDVRLYPVLEDAIRSGAVLSCNREPAKGGYARVAALGRGNLLLALGTGVSLHEALTAAEHDLLNGGVAAGEFREDRCPTCSMNSLDPAGSVESDSALDRLILDGHRFHVENAEGQFRLVADWFRDARLPREVLRQLITERVPSRWQHGDYIWEVTPTQDRKTGEWRFASMRPVSRPAGAKDVYPRENRRVDAIGPSLVGVLAAIEAPLTTARAVDEQWRRGTTRL